MITRWSPNDHRTSGGPFLRDVTPSRTTACGSEISGCAQEEDEMARLLISVAIGALAIAAPVAAHHVEYLDVPFDSKGECEAFSAQLRNDDRDYLEQLNPQVFQNAGDVNSFLSRAFTCELSDADGEWYITDHRLDVINSEWFQRRFQ
jgi:hypothetical protein